MLRLPDPCLVVLVGATAAGKSHWAARWFEPDQVVSSDRLRAVVGRSERDQRASRDAFEVLDLIVAPDGAALHSRTKFTTIKDWPDFELWPTHVGDVRIVESINMYRTAGGKIVQIKSGRYSSR